MKKSLLPLILVGFTLLTWAKGPVAGNASLANNHAPLSFLENKGQVMDQNRQPRPDIQFAIKAAPGLNIFIGNGAIHYQFGKAEGTGADKGSSSGQKSHLPLRPLLRGTLPRRGAEADEAAPVSYSMYRMDVELIGANLNAEVVTEQKQDYYENYFNERTGEHGATAYTYNRITYKNIYPNIDWVLYMKDGQLEHEFVIHAGGRASDIQLKYGGATGLKVNADGSLTATTPQGIITEQAPKSYQPDGTPVKSGFKLSGYVLSYETGGFKGEMVIDPTLQWATYMGGALDDYGYAITTDTLGKVYITGTTVSNTGIATTGAYQVAYNGNNDAYIAKFDGSGNRLWSTYYGGSGEEYGYGITTDKTGYLYVVGQTSSTAGVVTPGAYKTVYGGGSYDAFLAKFDFNGAVIWATYFGDSNVDQGLGVCTDKHNNIYITGTTSSSNGIATSGTHQTTYGGGNSDIYIAKFTGTGAFSWATYYGGTDGDESNGIAADSVGRIYITGSTFSTNAIATAGAYKTTISSTLDACLAAFDSTGKLLWGTYYGGSGAEYSGAVTTDAAGGIYITGSTGSGTGIATTGTYRSIYAAGWDSYLAKFSSSGAMLWGTYYGGAADDRAYAATTDMAGNIYLTGYTQSDTGIATPDGYETQFNGGPDIFVAKFSSAGQRLWGSYYGGPNTDYGYGVAVDKALNTYITGYTFSNSGIATPGAFQTTDSGGYEALIVKLSFCDTPVLSPITGPTSLCALGTITLTDTTTGGTWGSSNTNLATVSSGEVSGLAAGLDTITYSVTNGCGTTTVSYPVTVNAAPTVNAVANQTVCAGDTTTTIHFTGTGTGTVYNWTCNNPSIGLAASGIGSIGSFTAVNTGNTPVVAQVTVTPVAPTNGYAYIANEGSGNVSVINTATNMVTATIPTGDTPYSVAVSPDGSRVYVVNANSYNVSVINTSTNTVIDSVHVYTPRGVAVSPDGSRVYVTSRDSNAVYVINTATNAVTNIIGVGLAPGGVAVSPDGSKAYVTCGGQGGPTDTVSVINTATNTVIDNIIVGTSPWGVAVSPDGSKVYVTHYFIDSVSVINAATNTVTASINVGFDAIGIAVSPDGSKLYVANGGSASVSVINTSTNVVTATIQGESGPIGISVTPDGSKVYVANQPTNSVYVINASTNTIIDSVAVGNEPQSYGNFITSGTGCTGTPKTFTITVNPQPTASIIGTAIACGSVSLTATGGTTYAWSGGNTPNNADNTFTSSGTYAVTVSNGGSCSATAQQVVTVNTVITAGITGTAIACGSVNLTATGGGTYAWSGGGSPGTAVNTFTSSATYTVTVTNNSCTATASQAVTVNTVPTATYTTSTGRTSFCQGDSLTLTAATEHGYLWSGGATTQSITVTQGGNEGVTVTDNNGCSASTSENISAFSVPTSSIVQGDTSFCTGDSITLTSASQFQYLWSTGATTQNIVVSQAGSYTVKATNPVGCSNTSAPVIVTVNAPPAAAINGPASICANLSATLTASGGTGYSWSNGLGTNASVTVSPANTTTYFVTVTDAHNCSATAQQTVNITNAPVASITGPTQICYDYDVILYAHGGNTYAWSGGLGTADSIEDFPGQNTTYTVTVSIGANCSATASQTVNVYPEVFINSFDTICAGQTYPFGNRNLNQSGTYNDTLQTVHGCDSVIFLQLTVNNAAQTTSYDTICKGAVVVFHNQSLSQSGIYYDTLQGSATCDSIVVLNLTVDSGSVKQIDQSICSGYSYQFHHQALNQSGTYFDTLQTSHGCDSIVVLFLVVDTPGTPTIVRHGDTLETQLFSSYQWLLNGAVAAGNTQSIVVTQNGNYSVAITGGNGCADTSAVLNVTGLGINDVAGGYGVKLYPNPNNGSFVLEFTDDVVRDVEVTDAVGRTVVVSSKVMKQQVFNLDELAAGIYILHIKTGGTDLRSLKFSVVR